MPVLFRVQFLGLRCGACVGKHEQQLGIAVAVAVASAAAAEVAGEPNQW